MKKNLFLLYLKEVFTSFNLYIAMFIVAGIALFSYKYQNEMQSLFAFSAIFPVFGFFRIVAYIPACFVFMGSFCDDYSNQYIRSIVIRSSVRKYSIAKFLVGFISSFMALFMGLVICLTILSFKLPLVYQAYAEEGLIYGYFIKLGMPLLSIFIKLFLYSLYGAMYSSIGLVVSAVIPNKFLTYVTPFVACFILDEIGYGLQLPFWLDTLHLGVAERIFGNATTIEEFKPDTLVSTFLNLGYTILFAVVFTTILYLIFNKLVKKRVNCELS